MTNGNDYIVGETRYENFTDGDEGFLLRNQTKNTPITKREYFAALMAAAMLPITQNAQQVESLGRASCNAADRLIAALNEEVN